MAAAEIGVPRRVRRAIAGPRRTRPASRSGPNASIEFSVRIRGCVSLDRCNHPCSAIAESSAGQAHASRRQLVLRPDGGASVEYAQRVFVSAPGECVE